MSTLGLLAIYPLAGWVVRCITQPNPRTWKKTRAPGRCQLLIVKPGDLCVGATYRMGNIVADSAHGGVGLYAHSVLVGVVVVVHVFST